MASTIQILNEVIEIEGNSILALKNGLRGDLDALVETIATGKGRLVVCGIGKSGIIGKKISTTFASTGTPSFFMHPVEALHGDLGMLSGEDILLAISYSGETEEILRLIPHIRENRNHLISMTGFPESTLAKNSDFHLNVHVDKEACPLRLAPMSSSTATLVLGDALAAALIYRRGFKEEQFARLHPGGSLGKRLLTRVSDVMSRRALPIVKQNHPFKTIVETITRCAMGLAIVVDENGKLAGVITDGDLRRALDRGQTCFDVVASDIMNRKPKTVSPDKNLLEAQEMLTRHLITGLVVTDDRRKPLGVIHIHNTNA